MGRVMGVAALLVAVVGLVGADVRADAPSGSDPDLPATAGPDLLRMPPVTAPPLTNAGPWEADPLLVSGAVAYDRGELLYQDFLFDDHGADGVRDPSQPQPYGVAVPIGTYTYPTGPDFHGNDADIVEVRLRPHGDETLFRVTFNTMVEPIVSAFTVALGSGTSAVTPYPRSANVSGPADAFVTVHGAEAFVDGRPGTARSSVDLVRQQITVAVPRSVWAPGEGSTVAVGAGLWDDATDAYVVPGPVTTETTPGGSGAIAAPPAFFNVAFRLDEPIGGTDRYWSNSEQAAALAAGDMTPFTFPIDVDKLRRHERDMSRVPVEGAIDRIFSSRFDLGVGVDLSESCAAHGTGCKGLHLTRLQPYNLYVPEGGADRELGLTVLLHSLNANHNQYANTRNQSQYADRGQGTLVMTPLARGHDGSYYDYALADVFEVWADVARHYDLEPAFTSIAGYSMGGYGTFKLATSYPDLFARGHATVGAALPHEVRMPSLRNVPMLMWNAAADELVPIAEPLFDLEEARRYGLRLELDIFETADHLLIALNDEYGPGAKFLGEHRVDPNPAYVTYVVNPIDHSDHMALGLNADHAYWLSDMTVRTVQSVPGGRDTLADGRVDAHTLASGLAEPRRKELETGAAVLEGGTVGPLPYTRHILAWEPSQSEDLEDALVLTLTNIKTITVDLARAGLTCDADLRVTTDGPVTITLAGCGTTRELDVTDPGALPVDLSGFRRR